MAYNHEDVREMFKELTEGDTNPWEDMVISSVECLDIYSEQSRVCSKRKRTLHRDSIMAD